MNRQHIKILQTNLGRGKNAHSMAQETADQLDIDLVLVSEPNKRISEGFSWIPDLNADVAFNIKNRNLQLASIHKGEGFVVLELENIKIIGAYISPNASEQNFNRIITDIMYHISGSPRENMVLMGDFNSKAVEWGSPNYDKRGRTLMQAIQSKNMCVLNDGSPTFIRRDTRSHIDVTFASEAAALKVSDWQTLDQETLSHHKYITFNINEKVSKSKKRVYDLRKNVAFNRERFETFMVERIPPRNTATAEMCTQIIGEAYRSTRILHPTENIAQKPYWWTEETERARDACIAARRSYTRTNANNPLREERWEEYRRLRKRLNKLIKANKNSKWQELCDALEDDIWGDGYRIATKAMGSGGLPFKFTDDKENQIFDGLFPTRQDQWVCDTQRENVIPFTVDELRDAVTKIKPKTAAGPDGIPPEAIIEAVRIVPDFILSIMNRLQKNQKIPESWKRTRLVLIHKKGKSYERPQDYRPLCITNVLCKLFEHLVKIRLETEIGQLNAISPQQYGFRKGKSTLGAIREILTVAENCKYERPTRKWCFFASLDVRNAFNSAPWGSIVDRFQRIGISKWITAIISNYFVGREIITPNGKVKHPTAGIPQGAVLGPTVWDVFYDPVLTLNNDSDVKTIAFADDIGIVVAKADKEEAVVALEDAITAVANWMTENGLSIAPEKTEIIILEGKRDRNNIIVEVLGSHITPVRRLKYLGIILSDNRSMGPQVEYATNKASIRAKALNSILSNMGGPGWAKRRVLYGVVQSILLYGAPVWQGALESAKHRKLLEKTQRGILLRVCSAYRTVPLDKLQIIAAIPPIDLMVEERTRLERVGQGHRPIVRKQQRNITITKWQDRLNNGVGAEWTRRMIPDLSKWVSCKHKTSDFYITQALSNHGAFRSYTKRIGKTVDDLCIYCGQQDDAEHTIFVCERWENHRQRVTANTEIAPDGPAFFTQMLERRPVWQAGAEMIRNIMREKSEEERLYMIQEL